MVKRKRSGSLRHSGNKKTSLIDRLLEFLRPQASNHYRSKLLHPQSLAVMSFLVIGVFALINSVRFFPSSADRVLGYSSAVSVEQLLFETNQARLKEGIDELTINQDLNKAALAKAQDMLDKQYWAHVAPDGKQAWDFIKEVNYGYKYAGENLARDFSNSSEVVVAWMNSPTHRKNLLNSKFTQIGLAVVNGNLKGFSTTLVVQIFATPSATAMKSDMGSDFYLPKVAAEPGPIEAAGDELSMVAGKQIVNPRFVYSPLNLTRSFFLIVVILVILTLIYDSFIASNRQYKRLVGENLAHIALFIMVAFLLIIFKGGGINP